MVKVNKFFFDLQIREVAASVTEQKGIAPEKKQNCCSKRILSCKIL